MVPAAIKGKYVLRFTVTSQYTTEADIDRDWGIIVETHNKLTRDKPINGNYVILSSAYLPYLWVCVRGVGCVRLYQ